MAGLSDYNAEAHLQWEAGQAAMPAVASRFLALFTAAPTSDAGTGGTEASGGSYARQQVAGALTAGASFTTSSTALTLASSAPAWLTGLGTNGSGVNVWDAATGQQIGTVSSISGTTVTLTSAAAHASGGASDSLVFSAFAQPSASSGAEPATSPSSIASNAVVTMATASGAGWGTLPAWGLYDALSGGNLIRWDYLGGYKWAPFTCSAASPGVLTCPAHGFSNGDPVVVTSKLGGALPTTAGSWSGVLTVANVTTDTFTLGVNTTGTGNGSVRKAGSVTINSGNTPTFSAGAFTLMAA